MSESSFTGATIGRYRVRQLLGVGGAASVYEAEDTSFGRIVALKIPHESVGAGSLAATRLVREARASGAVGHPNVCEVSEIGTLPNGCPFVVMERLQGETLRERIEAEGRLAFGDAVDIVMQTLSGLGAAHERGIIHRDVKPENVFLARRPGCPALVKILDFGLVTSEHPAGEDLTAVGQVVGTPYYMAPEQIRGVRDFHPRIDLYACGVVLYEAVTGRRPFSAETAADVFQRIVAGDAPRVGELRSDTPQELVEVIETAMSASPQIRYASAADFQRALANVRVSPPTPLSLGPLRAAPPIAPEAPEAPTLPVSRALEETRVEGRAASEPAFAVAPDEEWDVKTLAAEWEQPTVKKPLTLPRPAVPKKK